MLRNATKQTVNRWIMNCGDMRNRFTMTVEDSTIQFDNELGTHKAYVNEEGLFRMMMPLPGEARASGGTAESIHNGKGTLILEGNLGGEEPFGQYTNGIAEFGNAGCSTRVRYVLL